MIDRVDVVLFNVCEDRFERGEVRMYVRDQRVAHLPVHSGGVGVSQCRFA